jgi:hypothetical protein
LKLPARQETRAASHLPAQAMPSRFFALALTKHLDYWAALFAWQCDRIDETIQVVGAEQFVDYLRKNLLRNGVPIGFLAICDSR